MGDPYIEIDGWNMEERWLTRLTMWRYDEADNIEIDRIYIIYGMETEKGLGRLGIDQSHRVLLPNSHGRCHRRSRYRGMVLCVGQRRKVQQRWCYFYVRLRNRMF